MVELNCFRLGLLAMICLLGAGTTSAGALTPVPATEPAVTATPCPGCTRLGFLSVSGPTLDPPQPAVGDTVTFTFSLSYRLPGTVDCNAFGTGGSCRFDDDALLLEGDERPTGAGAAVIVRRRVGRAGSTTVQLSVRAMTEDQCYYLDPEDGCRMYFQYAFIDASSPPFVLQVRDAATPIPTDTPELAPCRGDCDGDQRVNVHELLTMVNIALGDATVATCLAGDADQDGAITIGDLVAAVDDALDGCGTS